MDTKTINSAIYTLLSSNKITEVKAVRLETAQDKDGKFSLGTIKFEDSHGREIKINVEINK